MGANLDTQKWPDNFLAPENSAFRAKDLLQPLDIEKQEIRLVELLPGLHDDPIHVKLTQNVSLTNTNVKYYAISYVVGDVHDTEEIFVDDQLLNVTANLVVALRQVRELFTTPSAMQDVGIEPSAQYLLWIDQVSINQNDFIEKGRQVLLMYQIYEKAHKVFVSLGHSEVAEDGFHAIRDILAHYEYLQTQLPHGQGSTNAAMREQETRHSVRSTFAQWYLQKLNDPQWANQQKGLIQLGKLPYWRRCWVYQEFVAASDSPVLLWGSRHFEASLLDQLSSILFSAEVTDLHMRRIRSTAHVENDTQQTGVVPVERSIGSMSPLLVTRRELRRSTSEPLSMILRRAKQLESFDARDRVYSMLGLSSTKHSIVPDYQATISAAIVFRLAAVNCALYEESLDFFRDTFEHTRRRRPDLSSWAPDYSLSGRKGFAFTHSRRSRKWDCTKGHIMEVRFQKCCDEEVPSILTVKSIILHQHFKSNELGDTASRELNGFDLLHSWAEMPTYQRTRQGHSSTGSNKDDSAIADVPFVQTYSFGTGQKYEKTRLHFWNEPVTIDTTSVTTALSTEVLRAEALKQGVWRFFCLENGMMGMVPFSTLPGDSICVIPGCSLPWVLRPRPQKGGYTLVGPAYVHEYMNGRAVDECESGQFNWTYLDLY